MHYAVPRMLEKRGALAAFYTDFSSNILPGRILRILPERALPNVLVRMRGRFVSGVPESKIHGSAWLGVSYANARRRAINSDDLALVNIEYGSRLCRHVAKSGLIQSDSAVFGFNSATLEMAQQARLVGAKVIMEQTIAPKIVEMRILATYANRYPDWVSTDAMDLDNSGPGTSGFIEREEKEWELADLILCGSRFVQESLIEAGYTRGKCIVVPYGVNESLNWKLRTPRPMPNKLRVLTVGTVGLRKGSPILLDVARQTSSFCEFKVAGPIDAPEAAISKLSQYAQVLGVIPRTQISYLYDWADVFLLPSLCEGSATVTYEATRSGVPVICSRSTGSQVRHEYDGIVCQTNSSAEYASILERIAKHSGLLEQLSQNTKLSRDALSEQQYEARLADALSLHT